MSASVPPPLASDAGFASLPPELRQRVRDELQPGERLVWMGQPLLAASTPGRFGCGSVFGIVMLLASALLLLMAMGHFGGPGGFGVVGAVCMGLLLAAAGGLILWSPALWRRRMRRTVYVLTDRRAIVAPPGRRSTESYSPAHAAAMVVRENGDGSGDLVFGVVTGGAGEVTTTRAVGFIGVPRVRDTEALVRRTLLTPTTPG